MYFIDDVINCIYITTITSIDPPIYLSSSNRGGEAFLDAIPFASIPASPSIDVGSPGTTTQNRQHVTTSLKLGFGNWWTSRMSFSVHDCNVLQELLPLLLYCFTSAFVAAMTVSILHHASMRALES